MPPSLASLVFWAFIAWLVYRDAKNAETSLGLWLPTISLSIMASKPVVYWLYGQAGGDLTASEEAVSGNPTDRTILLVLFFLGIVTLIRRGVSFRELMSKNLALCAL